VHWGRGWRKKERPYFVRFCIIARYAGLTEETNGGQKRGEMEEHLCHFVSDRHPDSLACSFASTTSWPLQPLLLAWLTTV